MQVFLCHLLNFIFQSNQKLSKNQRKKQKLKAKKQQKLLQMQIEQIEATEREGKPLIDVSFGLIILKN